MPVAALAEGVASFLNEFPELLRYSLFDVDNAVLPLLAILGIFMGVAVLERWRARLGRPLPSQAPILALIILPLAMVVWAAANYGAERGAPPGAWGWRSALLTALGSAQLPTSVWVLYKTRRWPWLSAPLAVLFLVWAAMSWFIGTMALADDWI